MTVGRIPVIEGGIQPTIFDAKGDLLTASANDTPARLAVGANGTILEAASGEATGLKWGGAWTTWTPTIGNFTIGNGTAEYRYAEIGKTVFVNINIAWGSTTSLSGAPNFSLPVAAKNPGASFSVTYEDSGTAYFNGVALIELGSYYYISLKAISTSGTYASFSDIGSAIPFTWTTNDKIRVQFSYEAA